MTAPPVRRSQPLAKRLAEAEATIEALVSGQVDAVVDPRNNSPVLLAKAQSALRESETALRAERDRAQRYLDTAEVVLLGLDIKGRITMVNRYACSLLGWSESYLLGRDFIDTCVPSELRDQTRQRLGQVLTGPDKSVVENPVVTQSGEERMIEWRNTLQRDGEGRVVSVLTSGTDFTERNRASERQRIAEERTQFILKAAGIGIWDMNYVTGVLAWSETLEAHYGLKPGTFGGTWEEFVKRVHPDDREPFLKAVGTAMKDGSDFSVQNRSLWPDGTVRRLTGAGRIQTDEHGAPIRGAGISIDITERRQLEEQFHQAQKMEAVGRLAGGIAHDFNNLLMVITGYSDILLQGLLVGDPRRADLEQIGKAAQSATALTRQLLAFSRQQVIEPVDVALDAAVASSSTMLKRLIGEDVELVTSLHSATATVRIDPGQLEQVIMNLSVNARDAMPTGGKLTIETAIVDLTEADAIAHWPATSGRFALLAVSDTGVGMDRATQAKIFEPFFTTKEQGKGTGLGLATVHGIVNQSGGFIWLYSELGQGTTFKIYLPLVEGVAAINRASPVRGVFPYGVESVLLAEDSDGVRDIATRVLEQHGYKVAAASSAAAALDLAAAAGARFDLLLTDIVMPGMSGRVLADAFLERHPKAKVLYMSGYTDDAVVRHGVLRAETPFLQKPFSPRALASRVRELLDSS
jgi:two-component system cell cycle sensor histidine kinase/response regulator CckA